MDENTRLLRVAKQQDDRQRRAARPSNNAEIRRALGWDLVRTSHSPHPPHLAVQKKTTPPRD